MPSWIGVGWLTDERLRKDSIRVAMKFDATLPRHERPSLLG
jgi:hypothetical protein